MKTRLRLLVFTALVSVSCASMSSLQKAQVSHDALALAQDTEAQLCWGVSSVAAAMAANVTPNHCTAPTAATIKLTDAVHQDFNRLMGKALEAHMAVTRLLASGAKADLTDLNRWIQELITIVANFLQTNPQVQTLGLQLNKARLQ